MACLAAPRLLGPVQAGVWSAVNAAKRFRWMRACVAVAVAVAVLRAHAAEPVDWRQLPATAHAEGVALRAWWSAAPTEGRQPAVVMLHGCGGMLNRQGAPSVRMHTYAQLLNAQGWHVLALDSLTPRGETELCTQRTGTRKVTMVQRRADTLAALQWVAAQPGVDPQRLALLGWSNGGSAVLASTNLNHPAVAKARTALTSVGASLKLAVAFYPGCATEVKRGYQPWSPTLLLLGLADDWTPAAECLPLASGQVQVQTWAGAHHGFDGTATVVHRTDVPNGAHPGQGVHVGGQPQARVESRQLLVEALTQAFAR